MKQSQNSIDISKDIAILVKRTTLDNNTFLYKPMDVVIGRFDKTIEMFETPSGNCYYSMDSAMNIMDPEKYCIAEEVTDIELMEMYKDETNHSYQKSIREYYKNYEKIIYLLTTNKNYSNGDDYCLRKIQIDDLFKLSNIINTNKGEEINKLFERLIEKLSSTDLENKKTLSKTIEPLTISFVNLWNKLNKDNQYVMLGKNSEIKMSEKEVEQVKKNNILDVNIKEICKKINETVIGQEEHVERFIHEIVRLSYINKNNNDKNAGILLTGSTGVGKTKIVTMLGKFLEKNVLVIDSTQLTIPGYIGMSIEDFLEQFYKELNKDKNKVENSIIVFDEIDKKGSRKNSDVSGKGVLNTLLKFLDGTTYKLKCGEIINTKNMIVIFSGAFSNVYEYNKKENKSIGFIETKNEKENITTEKFIEKAEFPDESMGRFPVFIHLNTLNLEDLVNIMKKSNESDIKIQEDLFKELGFPLIVEESYYNEIAKKSIQNKTGARSLQKYVYESTIEALKYAFDNIGNKSNKKIILTKDTVNDPKRFIISQNKTDKVLVKE